MDNFFCTAGSLALAGLCAAEAGGAGNGNAPSFPPSTEEGVGGAKEGETKPSPRQIEQAARILRSLKRRLSSVIIDSPKHLQTLADCQVKFERVKTELQGQPDIFEDQELRELFEKVQVSLGLAKRRVEEYRREKEKRRATVIAGAVVLIKKELKKICAALERLIKEDEIVNAIKLYQKTQERVNALDPQVLNNKEVRTIWQEVLEICKNFPELLALAKPGEAQKRAKAAAEKERTTTAVVPAPQPKATQKKRGEPRRDKRKGVDLGRVGREEPDVGPDKATLEGDEELTELAAQAERIRDVEIRRARAAITLSRVKIQYPKGVDYEKLPQPRDGTDAEVQRMQEEYKIPLVLSIATAYYKALDGKFPLEGFINIANGALGQACRDWTEAPHEGKGKFWLYAMMRIRRAIERFIYGRIAPIDEDETGGEKGTVDDLNEEDTQEADEQTDYPQQDRQE